MTRPQLEEWLGLCPECLQSKHFSSQRERDLWERFHTHDPEVTE